MMTPPPQSDSYLTIDEAADFVARNPKVCWIDLVMFDMNGIARGKRVRPEALRSIAEKGLLLPSTVYIIDTLGNCCEETGRLWETGDPDMLFRVLAGTLSAMSVGDGTQAQAVVVPVEADGGLDARNILKRQRDLLASDGLRAVAAVELEFYVTKRRSDGVFQLQLPDGIVADPAWSKLYEHSEIDHLGPFVDDVYRLAGEIGLPVGAIIQEAGPGQFEINLDHIDDVVKAGLDALLLKRIVKAAAKAHGLDATFMAKPHHDWSGSGMHVHMSLIDGQGRNVLAGAPISERFTHAIGGLQATMPEFMAIWAQSANAYRRYVPKSYVALQALWGFDNRNVALRIPRTTSPNQTRIEHRISGADANPYLVLAAIIAGMRHGMQNAMPPGPAAEGAATNCPAPALPTAWVNALTVFAASTVVRDALGAPFHDVFHKLKTAERLNFERAVTSLDYDWYAHVA